MITPAESKAARKLLQWTKEDVATRLLISTSAVKQFEQNEALPWTLDLRKLREAYEVAGVVFKKKDGVRLKRKKR
jgi:transcriptional regulator with XRE-family HTH domain